MHRVYSLHANSKLKQVIVITVSVFTVFIVVRRLIRKGKTTK